MDWNDLRYAAAVAHHGGLSGAARSLDSSPQTVGRRVATLEAALGVALFVRHPSGYRLTEDGLALLGEAEAVEAAMLALQAKAAGLSGEIAGLVRIAAPETIATQILLPSLAPLLDRYPRLEIELLSGTALIGMARGEADIAVRIVRPEQGALTIRKIGSMGQALYARPGVAADLATTRLVGWPSDMEIATAGWLRRLAGRDPDIRLNHLAAHEAAIRAGLGIGVLPCFLASGLDRIEGPSPPLETIWLVTRCVVAPQGRVRTVYDEISRIMVEQRVRLDPSAGMTSGRSE